jgi:hypothetical protein
MNKDINKKSGFATAALVLGIIGLVFSPIPIINNASFILGALAVIFGLVALSKKKSVKMSIVAVILAVISIGVTITMQKAVVDSLNKASEEINSTANDMSGDNTDSILENDIQVDIGEFTTAFCIVIVTPIEITAKITATIDIFTLFFFDNATKPKITAKAPKINEALFIIGIGEKTKPIIPKTNAAVAKPDFLLISLFIYSPFAAHKKGQPLLFWLSTPRVKNYFRTHAMAAHFACVNNSKLVAFNSRCRHKYNTIHLDKNIQNN